MDWQPIETAPKDGSCILLFFGQNHYDPLMDLFDYRYVLASWVAAKNRWLHKDGSGAGSWHVFPTHWMPLPAPPQEDKSND